MLRPAGATGHAAERRPTPQPVATKLDGRDIRLFDYAKQFALPFREAILARTAAGIRGRREESSPSSA